MFRAATATTGARAWQTTKTTKNGSTEVNHKYYATMLATMTRKKKKKKKKTMEQHVEQTTANYKTSSTPRNKDNLTLS